MRNFKEHAVVTNNISGLIDKVLVERGLNKDDVLIRGGLDGGGGFLKVCISLFDFRPYIQIQTNWLKNLKILG